MVATEYFRVDGCRAELFLQTLGDDEIVDAPPGVLLAGMEAITPPRIRPFLRGIEMSECVYEPTL